MYSSSTLDSVGLVYMYMYAVPIYDSYHYQAKPTFVVASFLGMWTKSRVFFNCVIETDAPCSMNYAEKNIIFTNRIHQSASALIKVVWWVGWYISYSAVHSYMCCHMKAWCRLCMLLLCM